MADLKAVIYARYSSSIIYSTSVNLSNGLQRTKASLV